MLATLIYVVFFNYFNSFWALKFVLKLHVRSRKSARLVAARVLAHEQVLELEGEEAVRARHALLARQVQPHARLDEVRAVHVRQPEHEAEAVARRLDAQAGRAAEDHRLAAALGAQQPHPDDGAQARLQHATEHILGGQQQQQRLALLRGVPARWILMRIKLL